MQITLFKINEQRDAINLTIIDAQDLTSLKLFTDKTYKDYSKAIDLSNLIIEGASEQNIEISLNNLEIPFFDGIYFIEIESNDSIEYAITQDLTKYKECILEKLVQNSLCDDCLKKKSVSLLNSQSLLYGIESAIQEGFIEEAFNLIKALSKFCDNKCKTCGRYNNIIDNNYYNYN